MTVPSRPVNPTVSRRTLLLGGAGLAGTFVLSSCGRTTSPASKQAADIVLTPRPTTIDLAGRQARTWAFDGRLPGREIRLRQGVPVRVRVDNELPEATSVHWHGIRLRNAMDGVPGLTQDPIAPGKSFLYEFTPPDAGTFLFHPHVGVQLDRGMYGALVVESRSEPLSYDRESVVILDDWLDGVAGTPERQLANLRREGMKMGGKGGMDMGGGNSGMGGEPMGGEPMADGTMNGLPMRGTGDHTTVQGATPPAGHLARLANDLEAGKVDPGDVAHPLYLMSGKPPKDPLVTAVRTGERIRLRLINVGADTHFCFFVEGHELTVTHADGQPVKPVVTDAVLIGMGERYDVVIEAKGRGVQRMLAFPLGKKGPPATGVFRYTDATGRVDVGAPFDMPKRIVSYADLRDAEPFDVPQSPSPRSLDLGREMGRPYAWSIGGAMGFGAPPIEAALGEPVRLSMRNTTMMPHPMHLHGHFFRAVLPDGLGARKDTIVVAPGSRLDVDLVADNPGKWAFHCHNVYHQAAGMERTVLVR